LNRHGNAAMLADSMAETNKARRARDGKFSLPHLLIYSALLFTYFVLVLRYLSGWLEGLFHDHRVGYAFAAILLMIVQAIGLESVSHFILRLLRRKKARS
jgi:hypothetical protein